ncbi:MAG: hypothetical protein JSV79_08910 [Armatimonadota bacterium]|nr:MAG: hypothetical protein JSV79_08910 [Armatimonadota bacterium]
MHTPRYCLVMLGLSVLLMGCQGGWIDVAPMHYPIYPTSGESVGYSVEVNSGGCGGVQRVTLYESVITIKKSSQKWWTYNPGPETVLKEWKPKDLPDSSEYGWWKMGGYGADRLVRYRVEVEAADGTTVSQEVWYAIRPYPGLGHPAPVYCQGEPGWVFDIVFIPDKSLTDLDLFRTQCRYMILDAMFAESTIGLFRNSFNFYINPQPGTAVEKGYHVFPSNKANLTFAEALAVMHGHTWSMVKPGARWIDCANPAFRIFSAYQKDRGAMVHEAGHVLFGLADEYAEGGHHQEPILPNNWKKKADAQADAPKRGKPAANAREIDGSGWYLICDPGCAMQHCTAGLDFDTPCAERVVYKMVENAQQPYSGPHYSP